MVTNLTKHAQDIKSALLDEVVLVRGVDGDPSLITSSITVDIEDWVPTKFWTTKSLDEDDFDGVDLEFRLTGMNESGRFVYDVEITV